MNTKDRLDFLKHEIQSEVKYIIKCIHCKKPCITNDINDKFGACAECHKKWNLAVETGLTAKQMEDLSRRTFGNQHSEPTTWKNAAEFLKIKLNELLNNINKENIMKSNTNQATLIFKLDEKLTPEQHKIVVDAMTNKFNEIIEAVKPKLDYYLNANNYSGMNEYAGCDTVSDNKQAGGFTGNGKCFNFFRKPEDAARFAKQRQIFDALANFSAENDPDEKNRVWNEINIHWSIAVDYCSGKADYVENKLYACKNINDITFSTKELVKAALEMLKRNELI